VPSSLWGIIETKLLDRQPTLYPEKYYCFKYNIIRQQLPFALFWEKNCWIIRRLFSWKKYYFLKNNTPFLQ
jgi:hypothetical protein